MIESLEGEIRDLRSLFWSERDPDGRGFAPLADAYRRAGDFRQALELVTDGLGRLPTFATGYVVSAQVNLDAGLVEEAELTARKALELDGENVRALRTLADALAAKGDEEGAAEARASLDALEPTAETVPSQESEAVLEAEALGPEEPEVVEVALEAEELEMVEAVLEVEASEPKEPEVVEGVVEVEAPEAEELEVVEAVLDIGALAPEEPEAGELVIDIETLAPEEPEAEELVVDIEALAPDEPDDDGAWSDETDAEPIYTRTMAELYVRQGLRARAVEVYRHLLRGRPDDDSLRARLAELETAQDEENNAAEQETEVHARYLADAGEGGAKVETPFAWIEEEAAEQEESTDAPPISRYFERMLAWSPREEER